MDGVTVIALICGLVVGLLFGSLAGWVIARARQQSDAAHTQMLIAQSHGDAATARAEAAQARADVAQARSDVAEARSEAAAAQAKAAEVSAEVAKAVAQRDTALDRAREIAADRESMINQFKVLSSDTLNRQGQTASAQAEERLKATEQ
ncbi:MAG TPA: DNA recombination protein RmuC, partial [Propionibacteriaceae bacterium]|nr:DNA recombination protein RmuC [Propionibacteriaceae bacterium]